MTTSTPTDQADKRWPHGIDIVQAILAIAGSFFIQGQLGGSWFFLLPFCLLFAFLILSWIRWNGVAFSYLARASFIVVLSTAAVLLVFADARKNLPNDAVSIEMANYFVVILKATSLAYMCLDGFIGCEDIGKGATKINPLDWVKAGSIACMAVAVVLVASLFPDVKFWLKKTFAFSDFTFSLAINSIAIAPMLAFIVSNFTIVFRIPHAPKKVQSICREFLFYVNIPTIFCTATVVFFAVLMEASGADGKSVSKILSGSVLFLVFSAMMVGLSIEHNQGYRAADPSEGAKVTA